MLYRSSYHVWESCVHFNRYTQFSLEASEEEYDDAICVNIEGVLKNEKSQGWVHCKTTVLQRMTLMCVIRPLLTNIVSKM